MPFIITIFDGERLGLHGRYFEMVAIGVVASSLIVSLIAVKWRAALTRRFQLEFLETAANLDIRQAVPTEESFAKRPRKIVFYERVGGNPPEVYQWWMLANPFVWLIGLYLLSACTVDEDLRKHGQLCSAKLVSSRETNDTWLSRGTTISKFQTDLTFEYLVKGKHYVVQTSDSPKSGRFTESGSCTLYALLERPTIHEPIGEEGGTKQRADFYVASLLAIVNLLFEF
ncbi:MAG: hypothetical protein P4L53_27995 [Candidatus Obscuribacterales bacterium]|nr:hypothetical protein [Candidatus Obscuribacterales bacterium]